MFDICIVCSRLLIALWNSDDFCSVGDESVCTLTSSELEACISFTKAVWSCTPQAGIANTEANEAVAGADGYCSRPCVSVTRRSWSTRYLW